MFHIPFIHVCHALCTFGHSQYVCFSLTEAYEVIQQGDYSPAHWGYESMSSHWMMVAVIGILALVIMVMLVTFLRFIPRRTRSDDVKLIH